MGINIALDGPSGAGKSTVAKLAANKLGFMYIDTGAMYRSIAYYMVNSGVSVTDEGAVEAALEGLTLTLKPSGAGQAVLVNGEDASDKIRTPEISMAASSVSSLASVRKFLLDTQRAIAQENNIIMDGRDIGTVILPNAQVKIFLTASAEARAKRRYEELLQKGEECTYEQVLDDINHRDYNDTHRDIAPLKQAQDAYLLDTTQMNAQQAADEIVRLAGNVIQSEEDEKKKPIKHKHRELMPIKPITKTHRINPIRQCLYSTIRPLVRFICKRIFKLTYEGTENVPKDGGNIFASNHRSYWDPVFIALMTRVPISYMAKEELFKQNIFFTLLIKMWGAFPVVRGSGDTSAIDTSVEKLESGRNLVIFPEGTRSKDGKVGKGKTGVALIAAVAQTRVIPVGINFEGEKLHKGMKVVVRYGKPIDPKEIGVTDTEAKSLKKIKNAIMDSITELVH